MLRLVARAGFEIVTNWIGSALGAFLGAAFARIAPVLGLAAIITSMTIPSLHLFAIGLCMIVLFWLRLRLLKKKGLDYE